MRQSPGHVKRVLFIPRPFLQSKPNGDKWNHPTDGKKSCLQHMLILLLDGVVTDRGSTLARTSSDLIDRTYQLCSQ